RADIFLCSSDVYFRVYHCLVTFAALFFGPVFDHPRPETRSAQKEMYHNIVIPVTGNSRKLDMLLRFFYPTTVDSPTSEGWTWLEAVVKYGMEERAEGSKDVA
ncbi:hypothetical protein HD554DRAFT_2026296, partial [Boletus coccyginus]